MRHPSTCAALEIAPGGEIQIVGIEHVVTAGELVTLFRGLVAIGARPRSRGAPPGRVVSFRQAYEAKETRRRTFGEVDQVQLAADVGCTPTTLRRVLADNDLTWRDFVSFRVPPNHPWLADHGATTSAQRG